MKDPGLYLVHMLERARRIARATAGGRDEFFASEVVPDAVVRNFEVMGEAASRVAKEVRERHPELPWRRIIGFRNVLIHGYHQVNLERVWQAVQDDLPPVMAALETILREHGIDPDTVGRP